MKLYRFNKAVKTLAISILLMISLMLTGCFLKTTAEEIVLSEEEVNIAIKEKINITALVMPTEANQKVTWVSNDKTIATVTDGEIKGISAGETFIIVASGEIYNMVVVNVYDPDEKLMEEALADENFVNYVVNTSVSIRADILYPISTSVTRVDGYKIFITSTVDLLKIIVYMLIEENVLYTATKINLSESDWEIFSGEVVESSDSELKELKFEDFTIMNGYYVLKTSKSMEYLDLIYSSGIEGIEDTIISAMSFRFNIENNKIKEMIIDFTIFIENTSIEVELRVEYVSYGDAVVEIPTDVIHAINTYKSEQ